MRTTGLLLLIGLFSGCSKLQTFRVVDAETGRPLEAVQAERLHSSIQASPMPFVLFNSLAPVERHATDGTGNVKFDEAGTKFMVNPNSKDPAHGQALVTVSGSGAKIVYPEECREITVEPVNGVLEIPLQTNRPGAKTAARATNPDAGLDKDRQILDAAAAAQDAASKPGL